MENLSVGTGIFFSPSIEISGRQRAEGKDVILFKSFKE